MINMRNMNRLIVIFACLLALAPINLSAQEKTQPAAVKKAPMAYEAFRNSTARSPFTVTGRNTTSRFRHRPWDGTCS